MSDVPNLLETMRLETTLLKTVKQASELEEEKTDPVFLSELLTAGKNYAALNPESSSTQDMGFFNQLWDAARYGGYGNLDSNRRELEQFFAGTKHPIEILRYESNLLRAVGQIPELEQQQNPEFLGELIELGKTVNSGNYDRSRSGNYDR